MKHLKTYEKAINLENQQGLDKFLEHYNKFKINKHVYGDSLNYIKYSIIKKFEEEFTLLYFYYGGIYNWEWSSNKSYNDKSVNNFIKKEVKKIALESILKKFNDDIDSYIKLKEFMIKSEKRLSWSTQIVKNIYFLFKKALRISPFATTLQKYNL